MEEEVEQEVETTTEVASPQKVVTTRKVIKEPAVKTGHPQHVYETKKSIFRTYQVVWYILGVIEVILALRFLLKIVAANPGSGFASMIYSLSGPFVFPFVGVLGISTTPDSGAIIEWPILIAMAIYWLIVFGIVQFLQFIKPVTQKEVEETVDTQ